MKNVELVLVSIRFLPIRTMMKIPSWVDLVAEAILKSVDLKDPFTGDHCRRVGEGSYRLARIMGLTEHEQTVIYYSGVFHDIGKMGIPDSVLLKPGKLTKEEFDIMRNHAEMSVEILKPFTKDMFFRSLIPGVRYHHEKFDGSGYPHHMKGEDIPLSARVIAVVDTYDAMSNARPYRQPLDEAVVLKELHDYAGRQFDPKIVEVFLKNLDEWKGLVPAAKKAAVASKKAV